MKDIEHLHLYEFMPGKIYWGHSGQHTNVIPFGWAFRSEPVVFERWYIRRNVAFRIHKIKATAYNEGGITVEVSFDHELSFSHLPFAHNCMNFYAQTGHSNLDRSYCDAYRRDQRNCFRNRLLEYRNEHIVPFAKGINLKAHRAAFGRNLASV